jgi:putative inorganic carbon (hco3(-)) transporter
MPIMTSPRQKIDDYFHNIIFAFFNILVFATPFVFTWFNQELFEFNKMIFVYALTSLIVAVWGLRSLVRGKLLWKNKTQNLIVGLFLISQLLATIFSMHQRTSIFGYYTRFNGGLLSIISYISLFFAAQYNLNKKQLNLLLKNLLFAALLISLYAIPEHFAHSFSCLIVTGKYDVSCWVQDVQNRVFATFGQPNWLASFLLMTIPLVIWQLWQTMQKKRENHQLIAIICYALLLMLLTIALFFTKSRSGILALGLATLMQIIAQRFLQNQAKKQLNLGQLLLPIGLILVALMIFGQNLSLTQANQSILSSLTEGLDVTSEMSTEPTSSNVEAGGSKSSDIRKVVWEGAWKVWQRYPIFGSGMETFAYSYYQDRPVAHNLLSEWDFLYNKAHNELLNFLATTGLVGLISYLNLFVALFIFLFKQWQKKHLSSQKIALASALVAMFISNFFGFSTVTSNLLFSIFAAAIVKEEIIWPKIKKESLHWPQYLLIVALLSIVIASNMALWRIWRADYLFYNAKNHIQDGNWQTGLSLIQNAIEQSPQEALFYDELASQYSILAIDFAKDGQATNSAKFAEAAIETSNFVQKLNPVHLNFHKSRAKIFIRLAQLDDGFYQVAKDSLLKAIALSPSEAKLYYNLALVEEKLGNQEQAIKILEETIALKANYWQAYFALGQILDLQGKTAEATNYYQYILDKIDPNNNLAKQALAAQTVE